LGERRSGANLFNTLTHSLSGVARETLANFHKTVGTVGGGKLPGIQTRRGNPIQRKQDAARLRIGGGVE
jgi:hypothetical protein